MNWTIGQEINCDKDTTINFINFNTKTMIDFTSKTVIRNPIIKTSTQFTKIKDRISTDLYNTFNSLNFAGVYRIGSESSKDECYIGSSYNITLKVIHHMNLLYTGKHHSKGLQDWVNANGLENIDISVLAWCKSFPDVFKAKEQYFIDRIKPKFNTILEVYSPRETEIVEERKLWKPTYIFVNEDSSITRIRGDITNIKVKKQVYFIDKKVNRPGVFSH